MEQTEAKDCNYRFGPFRVDSLRRILSRDGEPITLSPRSFDVLLCLIARAPGLVTKEDILAEVWPNQTIEENNLTHHISVVRRALGESPSHREYIVTLPGRGYRFIARLEPDEEIQTEAVAVDPVAPAVRPSRARWFVAGAIALVAAMASAAWLFRAPSIAASEAVQVTHFGLAENVLTDGRTLYITQRKGSRYSILKMPASGGPLSDVITPFRNSGALDFSPDGKSLLVDAFENQSGEHSLWLLPLSGGAPRQMPVSARGAVFSPDGKTIAFSHDFVVETIGIDGGHRRVIANVAPYTRMPGNLVWSPDGRRIRFSAGDPVNGGSATFEATVAGAKVHPIFERPELRSARWGEGVVVDAWTPGGTYFLYTQVFFPDIGVWAVRERSLLGRFTGNRAMRVFSSGLQFGSVALSPDGSKFYAVGRQEETRELARYDAESHQFVPYPSPANASRVCVSPDGRWIAYLVQPDGTLWIAKRDGSGARQITAKPVQAFEPEWAPDSSRIAFHLLRPGQPGKVAIAAVSDGVTREFLDNSTTAEDVPSWSPDGKSLMFSQTGWSPEGRKSRIVTMDLHTGALTQLPGSEEMGSPKWSPDGRYVAVQSKDSHALLLVELKTGQWSEIAHADVVHNPQWTRDSQTIFFQDPSDGELMPIYRVNVRTRKVETFTDRRAFLRTDISRWSLSSLSPDGLPVVAIAHARNDVYAVDLTYR